MDEVHTIYSNMEYGCVNVLQTDKRAAKREVNSSVNERVREAEAEEEGKKDVFKMCSEVQYRECTLHRKQRHPYVCASCAYLPLPLNRSMSGNLKSFQPSDFVYYKRIHVALETCNFARVDFISIPFARSWSIHLLTHSFGHLVIRSYGSHVHRQLFFFSLKNWLFPFSFVCLCVCVCLNLYAFFTNDLHTQDIITIFLIYLYPYFVHVLTSCRAMPLLGMMV